jgi:CheY-like chemotaxis protein/predicted ester cyclase
MKNTPHYLPRVLIVDDEREILRLCESALAPHANVTSLTRGADAFQAASAVRPDVIVLDLAMPCVDGWQVCRELRADVRTANIPVVVLTGHDDDDVTPAAIRLGVRAVLIKPCSADRLVASLLAAAEISQRQRDEEVLERYYELFNARRFADAERLVADDCSLPHPAIHEQQVGSAGYLTSMSHWIGAFPDADLTLLRIDQHDDGYRVDLLAEGTHQGDFEIRPFGWFRASGRKITLRLHHQVQIRNGKLTRSFVSFDPQDLGRQLAERAS